MGSTTTEPTVLDRLERKRQKDYEAWAKFVDERESARAPFEQRLESDEFKALAADVRDAEVQSFRDAEAAFKADSDQRRAALAELDVRIADLKEIEARRAEAASASKGKVEVVSEPLTYRRDNARGESALSYWRDLAMAELGIETRTGGTRDQARERLQRHAREMHELMPKRMKEREARAFAQVAEAEAQMLERMVRAGDRRAGMMLRELSANGLQFNPFEYRVTPNSTDGYGGYFIPPDWLVDQWIPGLRAHAVTANLCRQFDIPAGTNSINVPKLNQLTIVGYQQQNNSGLPSQDWTDTFVNANVKTVGGFNDVAIQVLEQSPGHVVDEVITTDQMAAYDLFLNTQVVSGDGLDSGSLNGGHLKGFYPSSNWNTNTVTFTSASPAPYMLGPGAFGPAFGKIGTTRFDTTNLKYVVHGSRWAWYSAGLDANNRPIGETAAGGKFNTAADIDTPLHPEGLMGTLPQLADAPVYSDNTIPTNDAGNGQDVILAGLFDDAWLFKSPLRTDVFREVNSGSLGVRFRLYNYVAMLVRYGQSFAIVTGTGLVRPSSGYGDYYR